MNFTQTKTQTLSQIQKEKVELIDFNTFLCKVKDALWYDKEIPTELCINCYKSLDLYGQELNENIAKYDGDADAINRIHQAGIQFLQTEFINKLKEQNGS